MCVVSFKNNYIFFHVPKCGGTSFNLILPNQEKLDYVETTHLTYIQAKKIFEYEGELDWFLKAKKISIIRNPYDRTISLYRYIREHTDHPLHEKVLDYSFTDFCYFLKKEGDESITSCFRHIVDEEGAVPKGLKYFKLENINLHLKEISEIVGIDILKFPHTNKSLSNYEESEESVELIRDIFFDDFHLLYPELL